jgi:hypothetical protein
MPFQPDICAFGDYLSASSEKPIHPADVAPRRFWKNILYFFRQGMRKNDFSQA